MVNIFVDLLDVFLVPILLPFLDWYCECDFSPTFPTDRTSEDDAKFHVVNLGPNMHQINSWYIRPTTQRKDPCHGLPCLSHLELKFVLVSHTNLSWHLCHLMVGWLSWRRFTCDVGAFSDESVVIAARWWFQIFLIFTPKIGEDFQLDSYFSNGLKPPTRTCVYWAQQVEESLWYVTKRCLERLLI